MPQTKSASHRPLPDAIAIELGAVLRRRREQAGLTQEDVAATSEVSVQLIRRLEAGKSNPTLGTLHAVALALGTNMAALLAETRS